MPVRPVISAGIGTPGSTSSENAPTISPPSMRTAPTSVILENPGVAPVVSRSTTVKQTSARSRRSLRQPARPTRTEDSHAEALVVVDDVGDERAHEVWRAVGDGEEAGPELAVVEGFSGLLEEAGEFVDRRERELQTIYPARLRIAGR